VKYVSVCVCASVSRAKVIYVGNVLAACFVAGHRESEVENNTRVHFHAKVVYGEGKNI